MTPNPDTRPQIADRCQQILNQFDDLTETGWTIKIGSAKRTFATCRYTTKTITVSAPLANLNPDLIDTVMLHEIAHAYTPGTGHGNDWSDVCQQLGIEPRRTLPYRTVTEQWQGICPGCGQTIRRHRKQQIACARCCRRHNHGRFDPQWMFVWTTNSPT